MKLSDQFHSGFIIQKLSGIKYFTYSNTSICFTIFFLVTSFVTIYPQWENKHGNLPQWSTRGWAIDALDSLTAVIAVTPSGIPSTEALFKTTDGGMTWKGLLGIQQFGVVDVSIVDSNHIWICTSDPNKILSTSDGGNIWIEQYEAADTVMEYFGYIKMFDLNNGIAFGESPYPAMEKPAVFLRTTNGGTNWNSVNNNFINARSYNSWHLIDFITPETGFYKPAYDSSSEHFIFKTSDSALNWSKIYDGSFFVTNLKFFSENYGLAHLTSCTPFSGTYIFRTTNSGISWDSVLISDSFIIGTDFEFLPSDPAKIWFISTDKLYFSADSGKSWCVDSLSGKFSHGQDIVVAQDKVLWMLCETIYRNLNADHLATVVHDSEPLRDFNLNQNYPNPFNSTTKIKFYVPGNSGVLLKIFNFLGEEVSTLVNAAKSAGEYEVEWNARNIPSGVYFYSLTTENYISVKKMILAK